MELGYSWVRVRLVRLESGSGYIGELASLPFAGQTGGGTSYCVLVPVFTS